MQTSRTTKLQWVILILVGVLVLKVTAASLLKYVDYFPPNFQSDFLRGRESHFWGAYRWAFYLHLASGPLSLVLGLLLISERFRRRFPRWHRRFGRVQVFNVLCLLAPSGMWMAWYAHGGLVATVGFATLTGLTALTIVMGWRAAVTRRFVDHRRWMWRNYLLLCSAVVIRVIGGAATVAEFHTPWLDPLAAWISWLVPLLVFELMNLKLRRHGWLWGTAPR